MTDGGGDYGNNENCVVEALQDVTLSVGSFNTESYFDRITVNGQRFSGAAGPNGEAMADGETLEWYSDYSITRSGFVICAVPPSPPSPPLSPSPPAPPPMSLIAVTAGTAFCQLSDNDACVTTGPGNYGNGERCTVTALEPIILTARSFDTEGYYDFVTIHNPGQALRFDGGVGPSSVSMSALATLTWSSDGSVTRGGFVICATKDLGGGRRLEVESIPSASRGRALAHSIDPSYDPCNDQSLEVRTNASVELNEPLQLTQVEQLVGGLPANVSGSSPDLIVCEAPRISVTGWHIGRAPPPLAPPLPPIRPPTAALPLVEDFFAQALTTRGGGGSREQGSGGGGGHEDNEDEFYTPEQVELTVSIASQATTATVAIAVAANVLGGLGSAVSGSMAGGGLAGSLALVGQVQNMKNQVRVTELHSCPRRAPLRGQPLNLLCGQVLVNKQFPRAFEDFGSGFGWASFQIDLGINLYNESAANVSGSSSRRLQDEGEGKGAQLYLATLGMSAEEAFINSVVLQICIFIGLTILHLLLLKIAEYAYDGDSAASKAAARTLAFPKYEVAWVMVSYEGITMLSVFVLMYSGNHGVVTTIVQVAAGCTLVLVVAVLALMTFTVFRRLKALEVSYQSFDTPFRQYRELYDYLQNLLTAGADQAATGALGLFGTMKNLAVGDDAPDPPASADPPVRVASQDPPVLVASRDPSAKLSFFDAILAALLAEKIRQPDNPEIDALLEKRSMMVVQKYARRWLCKQEAGRKRSVLGILQEAGPPQAPPTHLTGADIEVVPAEDSVAVYDIEVSIEQSPSMSAAGSFATSRPPSAPPSPPSSLLPAPTTIKFQPAPELDTISKRRSMQRSSVQRETSVSRRSSSRASLRKSVLSVDHPEVGQLQDPVANAVVRASVKMGKPFGVRHAASAAAWYDSLTADDQKRILSTYKSAKDAAKKKGKWSASSKREVVTFMGGFGELFGQRHGGHRYQLFPNYLYFVIEMVHVATKVLILSLPLNGNLQCGLVTAFDAVELIVFAIQQPFTDRYLNFDIMLVKAQSVCCFALVRLLPLI